MLRESQIERPEHQDNSDVHHQPLPEPVPEEQEVHADHDRYEREHVKHEHDGCLSSHPSFPLRAAIERDGVRGARMKRRKESVRKVSHEIVVPHRQTIGAGRFR